MVGVPRWPAVVVLIGIGLLLAVVSSRLTVGPPLLPLVVILVLAVLIVIAIVLDLHDWRRRFVLIGLGTVTVAVAGSAVILVQQLVGDVAPEPATLLSGAAAIWVANVLTFALWYWEVDGGGPTERRRDGHKSTDLLFPQLQIGDGTSRDGWWPGFVDYLFVAFTASSAFSPTDTLVLSRRVKGLMMVQTLISMVTIVVIAARAINTLR